MQLEYKHRIRGQKSFLVRFTKITDAKFTFSRQLTIDNNRRRRENHTNVRASFSLIKEISSSSRRQPYFHRSWIAGTKRNIRRCSSVSGLGIRTSIIMIDRRWKKSRSMYFIRLGSDTVARLSFRALPSKTVSSPLYDDCFLFSSGELCHRRVVCNCTSLNGLIENIFASSKNRKKALVCAVAWFADINSEHEARLREMGRKITLPTIFSAHVQFTRNTVF